MRRAGRRSGRSAQLRTPPTTRQTRPNQSRSAANDGSEGKQIGRCPTVYFTPICRSTSPIDNNPQKASRRRVVIFSFSSSWQPKISTGTSRPVRRTVQATACSSPKLTAPTTMPCTWFWRNSSATPLGLLARLDAADFRLVFLGHDHPEALRLHRRDGRAAHLGGQLGTEKAAIGGDETEGQGGCLECHRLLLRLFVGSAAVQLCPYRVWYRWYHFSASSARQRHGLADLEGEEDRFGHVLGHHGRLQGRLGRRAPGEHAVIGQQDRRRPVAMPQDGLGDVVAFVVRIRAAGDLRAELVGDRRQAQGDGPARGGEGRGVVAVGVDDAAHVRQVAVEEQVVRQIDARPQPAAADPPAFEIDLHQVGRPQGVVVYARRLDQQPPARAVEPAGVARVHRHQAGSRQAAIDAADFFAEGFQAHFRATLPATACAMASSWTGCSRLNGARKPRITTELDSSIT